MSDAPPPIPHTSPLSTDALEERCRGWYRDHGPAVYGYFRFHVPSIDVAEDLTAETFLAAVSAVQKGTVADLTVAWLVGVARHKLVDHWRRQGRDERRLRALEGGVTAWEDPWDTELEATRARDVLSTLRPHHRAALTLRYLDGLPVPEVAEQLDRTVHATEALLVRARVAFRRAYEEGDHDGS